MYLRVLLHVHLLRRCFTAHRTVRQTVPLEDNVLSVGSQNQQEPRLQRSANGAADDKYDGHLQAATMRARPQLGPMIPYASNAQNNVSFDYRLHVRSAPAFELQIHGLRLGSELPQCWSDERAQPAPSGSSERMMSVLHQAPPGLEHATSANLYAPFDSGSWGDGDAAYWP